MRSWDVYKLAIGLPLSALGLYWAYDGTVGFLPAAMLVFGLGLVASIAYRALGLQRA